MPRAALLTLCALGLLAGLPLAALLFELIATPEAWTAWSEFPRLFDLARGSALLALGTLAVVMPLGTLGGLLLFRTDMPFTRLARFLVFLTLFVPLPVVTSAWQMALGLITHGPAGTPLWPSGYLPAILLHAVVSLPWVIVIVGLGLSWVEPELEEEGLLTVPAYRVIMSVTLPRAFPSLLLAAMWTVLQTLNELTTVTDTLVVRTFGEEVYYQYTLDARTGGPRAVVVSLPAIVLIGVLALFVVRRWRRVVPERQSLVHGPRRFVLGPARWPVLLVAVVKACVLLGIPLGGLLWKAGLRYGSAEIPASPTWEASLVVERFLVTAWRQRGVLGDSLVVAAGTGVSVGLTALWLCWLARRCGWFERAVWLLAAVIWAMPGAVLGVGLLAAIQWLLNLDPSGLVAAVLWERPSPLPNLWLCLLRFLPVGLVALAPIMRLLPTQLEESAELDGATPVQRFTRVILPILRIPLLWTMLGVGVLSLGELAGSKLASTPGFKTLAQHVFEQMHYGADAELASLCLVLLTLVLAGGVLLAAVGYRPSAVGSQASQGI
jgi:iron(III) transport system permease protein